MCIIVDANVVGTVLLDTNEAVFAPIRKRLFGSHPVKLVYGGQLREEYERISAVMRQLHVLDQAGRTLRISDGQVDDETERIRKLNICGSNDEHIIALARVSRVRLLVSADGNLRQDFKKRELVDEPRGKLYTHASHARLLKECP